MGQIVAELGWSRERRLAGRSGNVETVDGTRTRPCGLLEGPDGFVIDGFSVRSAPVPMVAVYVPTNNLYLGDIVICERERASFPNITVEEGIRIFLTGGTAMPPRLRNV